MAEEAVVSFAVETLGNLLIEKVVFLKGVKGDVEWVRDELKRMQCFLKDAANKQSDSESIRNWISEIREVAHDAEDAIEKFVLNVESRGLLQQYACFPVHVDHLNNIGNEIKSIRKRLEDIESSRSRYGIQNLGESSGTRSQFVVESRRRLAYWQKDSDVVGLEKDVQLLLDRAILEERGGLSVASIIGMGGIGKSTLAKKIYNRPEIANEFECRAWVVVSSEFTAEDITKQILVKLGISSDRLKLLESVDDKQARLQNLQEEVNRFLTGKRYFIVLDDVWEPSHWDTLRNSFPREDKASRLLLTSRNQGMEEYSQFLHYMNVLDANQSWELFMKKAFIDNTDGNCPEELQNIGEEILKRCGGLPLAISVVGGLLQKKLRTLRLLYLKESSVWQIQGMAGVTTLGLDMGEMSDASKLFTHLATLENLVSLTLKRSWMEDMDGLAALHHITTLKLELLSPGDNNQFPSEAFLLDLESTAVPQRSHASIGEAARVIVSQNGYCKVWWRNCDHAPRIPQAQSPPFTAYVAH